MMGLLIFTAHADAKSALSPEELLVRRKCTSCHVMPKQGKFGEEKLQTKLDEHQNRVRLSAEEKEKIVSFLKSNSTQ